MQAAIERLLHDETAKAKAADFARSIAGWDGPKIAAQPFLIPSSMIYQYLEQPVVQRNRSAFTGVSFALPDGEEALLGVRLRPSELTNLGIPRTPVPCSVYEHNTDMPVGRL